MTTPLGTHLAELGVLQNGIEKNFVGVNIFSCEVSEHGDVLRTVGKRQFYLHRVIVSVGKGTILGDILDRRAFLQGGLFAVNL